MGYTRQWAKLRAEAARDLAEDTKAISARLRAEAAAETGERREVMLGIAAVRDRQAEHDAEIAAAYERIARGEAPFPPVAASREEAAIDALSTVLDAIEAGVDLAEIVERIEATGLLGEPSAAP